MPKAKKLTSQQKRHLLHTNMQWASEQFPHTFRIIGFDLAKFKTGWTVLQCETVKGKLVAHLIDSGLINVSVSRSSSDAIHELYCRICTLMDKYEPDIVGYEYVAVLSDPTGFKALAKSEGILQLAAKHGAEKPRILVPVSISAGKKIASGGAVLDTKKALADFRVKYPNRNPAAKELKKMVGKIAVMNAANQSFGTGFTEDNICDSFLVANAVKYLAQLLHEADKAKILEVYDDKTLMDWQKCKWASPFDQVRLDVGLGLCRSSVFLKENDARANKKIAADFREMYGQVSDFSDTEESGDGDPEHSV